MPINSIVRGSYGVQGRFGSSIANYFGTGANGAVTYTTNTSLTVPNKNGSYDGDMVVMNYTDLTINSGVTLTTDQPCRGILIYVSGNCTINGTLSMKGRGPYADPTVSGASDASAVSSGGLQIPFATAGGTSSISGGASLFNGTGTTAKNAIALHPSLAGNGTVVTLVRQGAAGGNNPLSTSPITAYPGSNGTTGQTGGGGSGGGYYGESDRPGAGSYGSCFGGGSGGGGSHAGSVSSIGNPGTPWGGPGGRGKAGSTAYDTPGGIGNGNGVWDKTGTLTSQNGIANTAAGTGGLIILIVKGTLTVGSGGVITAEGVTGPIFNNNDRAGGGSSGGGNIVIAYKGSYSNSGSVTAAGGGIWGWGASQLGAAGGAGSIQTLAIL